LTPSLLVGLAATTASWSGAFRSYVRDHSQGVELEVVMDRAGLRRAQAKIDVLVLDDVMRTFSALDVFRARDAGIHVLGLADHGAGVGRQYLLSLGVDQVVAAATEPHELLALVSQIRPRRDAGTTTPNWPQWPAEITVGGEAKRARGMVCAWTKVSGGGGLTESVVAAAELLSSRARVLVIEAEEVAPILVSRLLRSPEGGLPWALSRVRQGLGALPEGLSGARDDGTAPVGHFDVICAAPGAAHVVGPAQLEKLVIESAICYDYVLVETGWLVGSPSTRERFSAARKALQMAGSIVVMAAADPEGAARLVQWKASALAAGIAVPCWAAFGRARKSRYEKDHLRGLVESNTGRHPYSGYVFLPEDAAVERARWNAEIAGKGPWRSAVRDLVNASLAGATISLPAAVASSAPVPAGMDGLDGARSGVMAI
jgi:hypothetical protein